LKLKVQPEEGVVLQFNAKKPASLDEIVPGNMDFCQNCDTEISSPEAYERLLADIFVGDTTRFTRWDELETAWRLTDSFCQVKRDSIPLDIYKPGSWGPHRATDMLLRSGRQWWDF
jgi:glucose-6-phosphate 1-dehydrogenase